MIKFSIIIPTYNTGKILKRAVESVLNQKKGDFQKEILLIDDCSTDDTYSVLENYKRYDFVKIFKTEKNDGPGTARNIGIQHSTGNWIIFMDSDDYLKEDALIKLEEFIKNSDSDLIAYNWEFHKENNSKKIKEGRYDFKSLNKSKFDLVKYYLSLGMDGSVIYTAFKSDLIKKNNLKFHSSYHEDVDFIFKSYLVAEKIEILKEPIYVKYNRKNSIMNTFSKKHIDGFFRAFKEIYNFVFIEKNNFSHTEIEELKKYFYTGIIGIVAVKVRDIWQNKYIKESEKKDYYLYLYEHFKDLENEILKDIQKPALTTKYSMIFDFFIKTMEKKPSSFEKDINQFMNEIIKKSWSCYDLHHSIFFAPDEIRTCCKRFFYDGKMKGDVVLLKGEDINLESILNKKKEIHIEINRNEFEECKGCPFLEFKDWGEISLEKVEYISLEYHSVCNMKCSYCSDLYNGGEKATYDYKSLLDNIFKNNLYQLKTIAWGGGEPTLDKNFDNLLKKIVNNSPNAVIRIFTNATKFSEKLAQLLKTKRVYVITSIDAGTQETFKSVRKNSSFDKVFENLKKYASVSPENIIIKYIILENNSSLEELKSFVEKVKEYELENCNFQISFNFKKEFVDEDSLFSISVLYGLLLKAKCKWIFLDDLLRQRLNVNSEIFKKLKDKLSDIGLEDIIFDPNLYKSIVIWGAGFQTSRLIEKSISLKKANIDYIVDETPSKIGTKFMNIEIKHPQNLLKENKPVLISAVQSSPIILKKFFEKGLKEKDLIKELVL